MDLLKQQATHIGTQYGMDEATTLYNTADMCKSNVDDMERRLANKGKELQVSFYY